MSLKKCNSYLTCLSCNINYNKHEKNDCNLVKCAAYGYSKIFLYNLSDNKYAYSKAIIERIIFDNLDRVII